VGGIRTRRRLATARTKSVARFAARAVPFIVWGLLAGDLVQMGIGLSEGGGDRMNLWKRIGEVVERPWSVPQRRLMSERQQYGLSDFIQYFGREPNLAEEVWNAVAREAMVEDFRPKPEDDLLKVFGLADGDLDDLVQGILERCGCRVPMPAETGDMPPVHTVEDLFVFVENMRKAE
jgi:hypothetical protein